MTKLILLVYFSLPSEYSIPSQGETCDFLSLVRFLRCYDKPGNVTLLLRWQDSGKPNTASSPFPLMKDPVSYPYGNKPLGSVIFPLLNSVIGCFLSNTEILGPAIELLALVLTEPSREQA